jgi:hypothetical protein
MWLLGYLMLQNRALEMQMVAVALAAGFPLTSMTRGSFQKPTVKASQASREWLPSVARRPMG